MAVETRIKIWGRKDSTNVQKVLWCCDELGIAYDRIDIGGPFGGNRERPYLDLNPNGLIPTIENGNFVLWESNSIVRYLVDKDGRGELLPSTPESRGDANRWMDWQQTTAAPAVQPVFGAYVRNPERKQDPAALEKALDNAVKTYRILDHHLVDRPYVAGECFSMGDIPLGVSVHRWFRLPIKLPELAHLRAWYDKLGNRRAYRKHILDQ
jgi:glutathione S-transferase